MHPRHTSVNAAGAWRDRSLRAGLPAGRSS